MTERFIYKLAARDLWSKAEAAGRFLGSPVDLSDGFIHFSTGRQVAETARRHYAGRTDLLLVAIATEGLAEKIRWEPSRGGELFPHLYEPLDLAHVSWASPLPLGDDGEHVFPDLETGR